MRVAVGLDGRPLMTDPARRGLSSSGMAFATLVVSVLAGIAVPPSTPATGISELELELARSIVPMVAFAVLLVLGAVWASLAARDRAGRLLAVLSLILVNIAGLFAGQYGVDGVGLLATVPVTAPLAGLIAQRETSWRRSKPSIMIGRSAFSATR